MGLAKVLGIILLILIIIAAVIGVDIYLTINTLADSDLSNAFSDPVYTISDDNTTVTISVDIDLPKAGFISKGIILDITVDFEGDIQTESESLTLGDSKTISFTFTLTQSHVTTLSTGGSISVDAEAEVTPTYFGFAISQATQTINLGSQTINA